MKYIINALLALTALPVFAHGETVEKTTGLGTGWMHGYGMMGWGAPWMGGWSWFGWLAMAASTAFWILIVVLLVVLIRWVWKKGS